MDYGSYKYTFNRVSRLIPDKMTLNILEMEESYKPWLSNELFSTVADQNPGLSLIYDDDIIRIVNLGVLFYNKAFNYTADISMGKLDLDTLLQYTKQDRYCVKAYNGMRVCTQKEVDEAVIFFDENNELNAITNNPAVTLDEKEFKLINLLTWALTGRWRYYLAAGYESPYENGKIKYSTAHYIMGLEKHIQIMCDRIDEGKCDAIISKIRHIRKLGKYKYTNYAADEIDVDVPISFVVTQVNKLMPRSGGGTTLGKCRYILRENKLDIRRYSTEDKINMRKGYIELTSPENAELNESEQEARNEIKEIVDKLKSGVEAGIIKEDDFCMKVAFTIAKGNYRFCSDKQRNVLLNGLKTIDEHERANKNKEELSKETNGAIDSIDFGISGLSSLLGEGKLSDGEFRAI